MKKVNMLRIAACLAAFLMWLPQTRAAGIDIADFDIAPGGTYTATVNVDPGEDQMFSYQGFQLDLTLPQGISVDLEQSALLGPLAGFSLRYETYADGSSRIMAYTGGQAVNAASDLMAIVFTAAPDAAPGKRTISITNPIFGSPTGDDIYLDDSKTIANILPPEVEGIYLYIPDFDIYQGSTKSVTVNIEHDTQMFDYKGFQFAVQLPSYLEIDLDQTVLTATLSGYTMRYEYYGDGLYRFMVYSGGDPTTATDGLISVVFKAAEDAPLGDSVFDITGQIFSSPTGDDINVASSSTTVTILEEEQTDIDRLEPTPGPGTNPGDPEKNPGENTQDGAALIGNDLIIRVGQTGSINIMTIPVVDYDPELTWTLGTGGSQLVGMTVSPDNSLIATFTGLQIGETTYTATAAGNPGLTATGKIKVIAANPILSLIVTPKEVELTVKDAPFQLNASITPADATIRTLTWTSSDPTVASVDQNGLVTPLKLGTTTVTARTTDGTDLSDYSVVRVVEYTDINALQPAPGEGTNPGDPEKNPGENTQNGAALIGNDLIIRVGQTGSINIMTIPVVDYDPELTWTLGTGGSQLVGMTVNPDNSLIATFTGLQIGETTYTATASDNPGLTATGKIKVIAANPILSLIVTPKEVELTVKDAPFQLNASITPADATIRTLTWTSSDPTVASVDQNGLVTPLKLGTTTVTARTTDGTDLSDYSVVRVVEYTDINALQPAPGEGTNPGDPEKNPGENTQDGAALIGNDLIIRVGQTGSINIMTIPVVDYDPELTWTLGTDGSQLVGMTVNPDNSLIATFTGLQIGETTYTATAAGNPGLFANGKIKVIAANPILSLTVTPKEVTLKEDDAPYQLVATITPENPTIPTLEWTSSDPAVATVDQNGLVTPVKVGFTTVTARTMDGTDLSDYSVVTVIPGTEPPGPEIPETPEVPATPIPDGTTGNGNGTYVEPVRIREGNVLLMGVNEPSGGYGNGFEYLWTAPDGEEIGAEREIFATALLYGEAAQSGERQAISDNVYEVTLSNYDEEGALFWETTLETATVKVYKRPQAPTQLLRKGQHPAGGQTPETGASCTFVVMMTPLDNGQILDLGYSYTYGYTDRGGMMHELGTTELRYIHTTPEIYWNEDYTFWAYSRWTYPDGSVVTSGLRYLDGGEDYGFDASDFDGTRGSGIAAVESEGKARGIYTLDGRYLGEDASALGRGLYIINGRKVIR